MRLLSGGTDQAMRCSVASTCPMKFLSSATHQSNGMLSDDATSPGRPSWCNENIGAEPELSGGDEKDRLVDLLSQALCM
ncbi:hypothetical protein U1Q18_049540, partial [Sarracenia purpurea var. burkii]